MDAYARLFCVRVNNAPDMNMYYVDKQEITNEEKDGLLNDANKRGFLNTISRASGTTSTDQFYQVGESMLGKYTKNGNT